MTTAPQIAKTYGLGVIKQAIAVCIHCKRPAIIWGGVGVGKSSLVALLASELEIDLWDLRLSDKEPSDLGGIPFPVKGEDGSHRVTYLTNSLIPFLGTRLPNGETVGEDYVGILFIDEMDRADKSVENVALQLLLDRQVNGHRLPAGVSVIAAGNGMSDNGTSVISDAAATRLVHFYVDTQSAEALDSWLDWAQANGIDPALRGFAKYRQPIFAGSDTSFIELQKPTPRTSTWAAELARTCEALPFGHRVLEPLVYGAVGQLAGREMIAFFKLFQSCPTLEQIVANPKQVMVPTGTDAFGLLFALGQHLINANTREGQEDDTTRTAAFATYANRWPEEQTAHFFKSASRTLTSIVHTPEYRAWEKSSRLS
jgi:hypothetical protein